MMILCNTSSYSSAQTPDSEAISQLIAGYIDIILKVRPTFALVCS
jgi:hypothetical protein